MLNEEKGFLLKNKFEELASKGDWQGYKNLVAEINNSLYVQLDSKFSLLRKFYFLLNSKLPKDFAILLIVFSLSCFLLDSFLSLFTNNKYLIIFVIATTPILLIQGPLYFIFLRKEREEYKYTKWEAKYKFLLEVFFLLCRHGKYIGEILYRSLLNIQFRNRIKNTILYALNRASFSYIISSIYVYIVHFLVKDIQFENVFAWVFLLIPIAIGSVWLNNQFVYKDLFSKFRTFNKFIIYISLLVSSFTTFFALLQLNIDYSSDRALKIKLITITYSCALVFMELIFSNRADCYLCGKEL